jgi:PAS domain S-box-containing protein
MREDISGSNFIETAEKFGVFAEIQYFATHAEVFAAVKNKEADAGVAPQHFGLRHAGRYNLVGSTILFSPFSIYFSSKKGTQHELLSHIDAHLSRWKRDRESFYYQSINHWMGNLDSRRKIPLWLIYSLIVAVSSTLLFLSFVLFLRRTVKLRNEELRGSEARFRDIALGMSDWIWEVNLKNEFCYSTKHVSDLLGYTIEEVLGKRPFEFMPPGQARIARDFFDKQKEQHTSFRDFENWNIRKDGQMICLLTSGVPMYGARKKELIGFRGIDRDITTRKHEENALKESEKRYRTYIMSAPYGVFVTDEKNNFQQVNPSACRMTGYEEFELLAKGLPDLLFEEDSKEDLLYFQNLISKGNSQGELCVQTKSGKKRWFSVSAVKIATSRYLGFSYDITERKQAEKEREKLQVQLIQSQKMEAVGTLAGGIAHDFNNILGAILGYAEMIRDDRPADSRVVHDISQVIKAGNRAKELVKQILAFSHQSQAVKLPVQPAAIIEEAVKMLRASLPATIIIEQDIAPDTGAILADPTQIHQIMINLATNALHAMELTGGTLAISLHKITLCEKDPGFEKHMQPGNFIQLSVKDSGVGIAPEIREKIFDPYFTTKGVGKGTGMGLAMVHGIVQSYGGFITCKSQLGKGTVFSITLPMVQTDSPQETEFTEPLTIGAAHILLIDDEEMLLNMSQTMPNMTGMDLAQLILQVRPGMPIILCTGYSSLITEEIARSIGIKGFAMKPLAKKDIATLIRKVLDGATR